MNARELNEKELSPYLEKLLDQIGLELLEREVHIGKFKLDAVAIDRKSRCIVVVELKVVCTKDALGQLLLYPRAVRQKLKDSSKTVRSLLITTHLDQGVVEIVEELQPTHNIQLWVCASGEGQDLRLVKPDHLDVKNKQVWDQSQLGQSPTPSWKRVAEKLAKLDQGAAS